MNKLKMTRKSKQSGKVSTRKQSKKFQEYLKVGNKNTKTSLSIKGLI